MKGISFLTTLLLVSEAFAQDYSIKGFVCDSIGEPESFATVRAYLLPDTVKPASNSVACENGLFSLTLSESGNYRINISSFGKSEYNKDVQVTESTPSVDLGKIVLGDVSSTLQELTVTAQKPLVSREIDRIGYDVQADSESKTSQLDEILRKVPLVSVDPDGTIKVKGSTNFKIYKNGKPNNSFTRNAKDIFKAIPASMIKKIEVITDPGAREDAEGTSAILNIVTIQNTVIKGVMGNVGLTYQRNDDYPNPSLFLTTQIDKVTLSAYAGYSTLSKRSYRSRQESLSVYDESGNQLYSEGNSESHGYLTFFGIDGSYELNSRNLFTAEFGGYAYNLNSDSYTHYSMSDALGNAIYSYGSKSKSAPNRYFDINGGVNYQHSTRLDGETITLSYRISTTDQKQNSESEYEDEENMPVPYTGTVNDFKLNFIEHTGQVDWTRPINDYNKFDVGTKYINRTNHSINNQEYIDYSKEYTNFIHRTQVFALYFDYRLNYKKFGARAGLRYEYSRLSAKYKDGSNDPFASNLNDWVPNAAISYNISDANTLKFSYSTHINRPGISQLNPAVVSTPSSISSGNPDLGSTLNHNLNLNFNHFGSKFNIDFNASYSFSNNTIINFQNIIDNDILLSGYSNGGRNRSANFTAWLQYSPWSKTQIMFNGGLKYTYVSNPSLDIKADGWSTDIYLSIRQTIPCDISISPYFAYNTYSPSLYTKYKSSFADYVFYGLNVQKSFLKSKRLSVRVGIAWPFRKKDTLYYTVPTNSGYTGYSKSYSLNQANRFSINVGYRFGKFNAMVKKTNASINNDDVENRRN